MILVVMIVFGLAAVVASYVLAWYEKSTVSDVTMVIYPSTVAPIVAYAYKSYKEKDSRNKHKVNEDGIPWEIAAKEENNGGTE